MRYVNSKADCQKGNGQRGQHIDREKELREIPASQRRPVPRTLEYYEQHNPTRNHAIIEAYRSGGYTLKQIGDHFGLHYSTVSGIVRNHKSQIKYLTV